ncbi:hypothetical protein GF337_18095, partial [candidate division KSB1 bacterium]|nr:hypothetical protein [candidate division KSB1 bacterium]
WLDVPADVLAAIKDLPVGKISEPVEMNGVYYIFQIMDIRRQPVSEYDISSQTERYRQILTSRKESELARQFVSEFMTPKNVVTKGESFRILASGLIEYRAAKSQNFEQALNSASDESSALFKLKENLNKTLVTFEGGDWSIRDFLDRFNENTIRFDPDNTDGYKQALNHAIALKVRDHFFTIAAKEQGMLKAPLVKKELKMWRDKWVYEEARNYFTENVTVNEEYAKNYFSKFKDKYKESKDEMPAFEKYEERVRRDARRQRALALLSHKADSLKTHYPVYINEAVLDTITVTDSRKSKWINMQVFKRSSGRMARPIVDPSWIQ